MMSMRWALVLLVVYWTSSAHAQEEFSRFEVGANFAGFRAVSDAQANVSFFPGLGGRFTYNLNRRLALEAEVAGVPQGVPQELVKGRQPAPEAEPAAQETQSAEAKPEPKPKPKPKPKVVERPKDDSTPTAVTVRPSSQAQASAQAQPQPQAQSPSQVQWPDPPPTQQKPTTAWPSSGQSSSVAWPDPPAPR